MSDFTGTWKMRRARKPHHCAWCGRDITRGERYRYATWVYDGKWYTETYCECNTARIGRLNRQFAELAATR